MFDPKEREEDSYLSVIDELVSKAFEVDSNVNEDKNRERQLDASLDSFLDELEESLKEDQQ